ncbi:hypothetical protein K458DRAFT_421023 [Lentithecium fluviatile CBS 122367]|uniref:Uncharacterized protein n=1 Tax=Lentithecium fluviatile CBS 122367 TaxID=1168545 RepID=A0A6G1IS89_9PLEO|nr:hypothetical protein K458DRAFT_421023 [Lentithecium fluviatile CBS 122367]
MPPSNSQSVSRPEPTATPKNPLTRASTSPSQPPQPTQPHPSLLRRLSSSVPEHAAHILERLFAPNTVLYTQPHNDPHSPHDSTPTSPTIKEVRRRDSVGAKKDKHVKVVEIELDEERKRKVSGESEFGVPLCREADIEKWKVCGGQDGRGRGSSRRGSWN